MRGFLRPAILSALLQSAVYAYVMISANRSDWHNIAAAIVATATVPFLAAAVLTAFRRNEAPIGTGVIVSLAVYSVAVTVLSAFRIPVSYTGLAWCALIAIVLTAYGNLRFNRLRNSTNIAVARFPGLEVAIEDLRGLSIIDSPEGSLEGIDTLLIDVVHHHSGEWSPLLSRSYLEGVEILPWTRYAEARYGKLDVESFDVSHLVYAPSQLIYSRAKRFFDVSFVLLTLPITLLLSAVVGLYIFARDGGPVIFVQIRRGYGGKRFRMYKFRTMYKKTAGGATAKNDKRIIPGCRAIRKFRIDELPQLLNILRGEMSLIGPRPVAEYVAKATERVEPKYSFRSLVLPGITGWAQVSSGYAETTDQEVKKLAYDLYYIKRLSFDLDLLVLFKTIRTVLLGVGAR
ncbi:sugar transferase [Devosia elaeis]|uniref:sugar transferase n=1 Tax=Devosia elaeis TaxID=1770058 RepID=UPI001FE19B30|nr:sugar transferase [Devosia elaeis]